MKVKSYILGLLFIVVCFVSYAQNDTIRIKTQDLSENYGLRPEFFEDTNSLILYLNSQNQDYNTLIRTCQTFAIGAHEMINDLDKDNKNGIVWLDATHCISDYDASRSVLQRFIIRATRFAEHYKQLEQEQLEQERKTAILVAQQKQAEQQEQREQQLADLKDGITKQHRTISSICDGTGITDKSKIKDLKDIYYSYLMIYNKYDVNSNFATDSQIDDLARLSDFQNDLLTNVLGDNSYINQIAKFKDELKFATAKNYGEVYKSYNRVFKKTAIAANFTNLDQYGQYIERLRNVIDVQQAYLETVKIYDQINHVSTTIVDLYGRKYNNIANAYKAVADEMYLIPAFNNIDDSKGFIQRLRDFMEVQKIYIANYNRLETISRRGDSIIHGCIKKNYDIVLAYRELLSATSFVGTYKTFGEADYYKERLDNFEQLQFYYQDIVEMRSIISQKDDSITISKSAEKVLVMGYKNIRKTFATSPKFTTTEQGQQYINQLQGIIDMQNICLEAIKNQEKIDSDKEYIAMQGRVYSNIAKAYSKVEKSYVYTSPILSTYDIDKYIQNQNRHIVAQRIFKEAFTSMDASAINQRLKRVSDVDKIKLILNIR